MILGLVKWMQPVHGYDVRRELESWQADEWANIAPGSIYHALRKLAEEGLLEEVATEQVGARPARTTYRVTAKGDAEFEELLRRYWWELRPADRPVPGRVRRSCPRCRRPRRRPRCATGRGCCGPASTRTGSRWPASGCARPSRPTWGGCSSCTWRGWRPRSPGASGSRPASKAGEPLFPEGMPRWPGAGRRRCRHGVRARRCDRPTRIINVDQARYIAIACGRPWRAA